MTTIWKTPVHVTDRYTQRLPVGAKFLSVQTQRGEPQIWWLVDDKATTASDRTLRVHGTGHPVENADRLQFLGTFQMNGGQLVFHLFEELCLSG